jgi:MerR family mercuric resistance operon transcriptional regulator
MRIGKLAKQVGITVEAIRYYEKQGLIEEPLRNESGYRNYPEETLQRIFFIKKSKELGFSLKEINELLHLRYEPGTTCGDVKRKAEEKIIAIDNRINSLQKMKNALSELTDACSENGPASSCPIIEALTSSYNNNTANDLKIWRIKK